MSGTGLAVASSVTSPSKHTKPHPLLLAAGGSGRFGGPKALIDIDGRTLLERWIDALTAVCGRSVVVVLGAHRDRLEPVASAAGASVVYNARWREGLSASVAAGVGVLPTDATGALLALCDQPDITEAHLARLVARWTSDPEAIVAARYAEAPGVPAIWPAALFSELAGLSGDRGAKPLFRRYADRVVAVALPEAAVDIDTPDDLARWRASRATGARQRARRPRS